MIRQLLILCLLAWSVSGATWYVDLNAVGANNGTSWASAWTTLGAINGVSAGDTVEISQGTYTLAATPIWTLGAGLTNNPIIYKHSRAVGHNGMAELDNRILKQHFTVLDGGIVDNFEQQVVSAWDTAKVLSNCGFYINGPAQTTEDVDGGACIHLNGADVQQNVVKWCIINPQLHNPTSQDRYGIRADAANNIDGIEIAYCVFTNVYDFAVFANQNDHVGFGGWSIHHCILQNAAPPGFCKNGELASAGLGLDVYNCIINRFPLTICGEQDNFQINYYWRMWNNIIYPGGNSTMQSEITAGTNYSHCYFYGNIIIPTETNSPVSTAGSSIQINSLGYDSRAAALAAYGGTNIHLSDFRFFNNTIYCEQNTGPGSFLSFLAKDFAFGWGIYMVPDPNGVLIYNNLLHTTNSQGFGLYPNYGGLGGDGGWKYDNTTVKVDYNVFGSINYASNNLMMSFGSASSFNAFSGFSHNTSTQPLLATNLIPLDTTAIGAGLNLSSFATNMPNLAVDANGVPRGWNGNWSIGAFEPSGLQMWLTFSPTNWALTNGGPGYIYDQSGNTNNGIMMAATNWPFITNGPIAGTYAGHWWPQYPVTQGAEQHNYGAYAAVTNFNGIRLLTNATICFWSFKDTNAYNASVGIGNMGTSQVGALSNSWDIACDGENYRFRLGWGGNDQLGHVTNLILFPIQVPNKFNETNWTHYAVVVQCPSNQVIGYYNGTAWQTNEMATVPYIRSDYSDQGTPWIGIGTNPHGGTPQMDYTGPGTDQFPNNGWNGGNLTDFRIYNRALSASEITNIFLGVGGGGSPSPPPPPPPNTKIARVTNLHVGKAKIGP